jgi:hypothetical protein
MRNGFDGLAGIVRNTLGKDPVCGDIFAQSDALANL